MAAIGGAGAAGAVAVAVPVPGTGAGAGTGAIGVPQRVFDARVKHFTEKPIENRIHHTTIGSYNYDVYSVDIRGFLGKQIILIFDSTNNNNCIAYFTFNYAVIGKKGLLEPWIELYDFQKNPSLVRAVKVMPILCTFLDYYKTIENPRCHIWAGSFVDKLIDSYVDNGFVIIYGRNESYFSPLGVQLNPDIPTPFTSLIYKPNLGLPLSIYKIQEVPINAYNMPIRFSFQLPPDIMLDTLKDNILADSGPERSFVFFSQTPEARSPPKMVWKGTHFELTEPLTRRQIDSISMTTNGGICSITGCVSAPINPGFYIIGHTHPKSLYMTYSSISKTPVLIGPPSDGDINININFGCPIQCVFAVEGVYVLETLKSFSVDEKKQLSDKLIQYTNFVYKTTYTSMQTAIRYLHSQYGEAVRKVDAEGRVISTETELEVYRNQINNFRRKFIIDIINFFNREFHSFIHMRFHLWNTTGLGHALIPSNITIRSLTNPYSSLVYDDRITGGRTFTELDKRSLTIHTMKISEAELKNINDYVNKLDIFTPLEYLSDLSDVNSSIRINELIFSNGIGNRNAAKGNTELSNEIVGKITISRIGESLGREIIAKTSTPGGGVRGGAGHGGGNRRHRRTKRRSKGPSKKKYTRK